MTTPTTYSSKSTAVRGFKRAQQVLAEGLDSAAIADRYIVANEDGTFSIKLDKVEAPKKVTRIYKGVQLRRRSDEPEGITSAVHDMFDEYQAEAEDRGVTLKRKDYIAKAVRDGVAYYTARTQYQKWLRG
jgi:murein DD-endopeptidase MepM/ murein hydrolase activator NlpD